MKTKIKTAIILFFFLSFLFSLSGIAFCNEDGNNILFSESFEESFPPEGWILVSENEENTWRQVDQIDYVNPDTGDSQTVYAKSGDYFAYVGGNEGHYNERLISPIGIVTDPPDKDKSQYLAIAFSYLLLTESPFYNVYVAVCYNCEKIEDAKWEIFANLNDIMNFTSSPTSVYSNKWSRAKLPLNVAFNIHFRVSLLYKSNNSQEFGIDSIKVGILHEEDDNSVEVLYPGPGHFNNNECSCASAGNDHHPDVFLGMLLIGAFVLILRPRKKR